MNLPVIGREMKAAQDLGRQIAPFTERVRGFDVAAGYEAAHLIHEARLHEGASPVGRKMGFTNRDMWAEHGAREPIWAFVYDTTVVRLPSSRGVCSLGRFAEPRIEPEIILHFRSAPALGDDPAAVLACVDWIAHTSRRATRR
jgi:2-keto-4-pentenoate hydratase